MKTKLTKFLCVAFALLVFAVMAMGSGTSEKTDGASENSVPKEEKQTVATTEEETAKYEVGTPSVTLIESEYGLGTTIKVAIPVKNTGTADLLLNASTIDIKNANDKLVDTLEYVSAYPDTIASGETGWYFIKAPYDGNDKDGLKVILEEDIEKSKMGCIRYDVTEADVHKNSLGKAEFVGYVENQTEEDAILAKVAALIFDADKNLLGVADTYVDLAAGEKTSFKVTFLDLSDEDIKKADNYLIQCYQRELF